MLVDGEARAKRHALHGGEVVEVREAPEAPEAEAPEATLRRRLGGRAPARGRQAGGRRRAPGARPRARARSPRRSSAAAPPGGEPGRAGLVHRLDRDTSGLLVVARSEEVHAALKAALKARGILREYLALVEGRPGRAHRARSRRRSGRDRRVRTRISTDTADGRAAITHFETEEALERYTLLRVRLETGRTHQIRAHLKAIGHPVAGDPEYGRAGVLGLERQFLHAEHLAFEHPVTGEAVDVRSPLPADLAAALDASLNAAGRPSVAAPSRECADRTTGSRGREGRPAQPQTGERHGTCVH